MGNRGKEKSVQKTHQIISGKAAAIAGKPPRQCRRRQLCFASLHDPESNQARRDLPFSRSTTQTPPKASKPPAKEQKQIRK
ncbi:hypothetical protein TIFTF001_004272 [Ficus carica]|uniref:Uncharacterized protein n=1 Tax=Ficus carica TaxID=3494 RepID=A0AA87ZB04_FICCA|nr:hypothetical protein TIFTF001_004272 [Ficus carica]